MKQLKLKQIMKQRDVSFVMNLFLIVWTTEPDMLIKSNNGGKCYAALITFDFSRYFVFISLGFFNYLTFFYTVNTGTPERAYFSGLFPA